MPVQTRSQTKQINQMNNVTERKKEKKEKKEDTTKTETTKPKPYQNERMFQARIQNLMDTFKLSKSRHDKIVQWYKILDYFNCHFEHLFEHLFVEIKPKETEIISEWLQHRYNIKLLSWANFACVFYDKNKDITQEMIDYADEIQDDELIQKCCSLTSNVNTIVLNVLSLYLMNTQNNQLMTTEAKRMMTDGLYKTVKYMFNDLHNNNIE